ncbi:nicotinamide-nucleotide amidase [Thermotomaculum hydrothermale]|uniref:CinA-like protein n=1 Tax=Thermotomaculum hydrothermale TaxID=981385 RepID=A0A7R6PLZ5_9BACT|nr:competence/damage-inducible protein A [Thermotomaculum hydrothermale]BBB32003.1 nicotinamide-nucleotide amidase [Thermotomaculum hydrothermale]
MKKVTAEIIAIGSELLGASKVDTNSLFITKHLNKLGIEVSFKTVVGDNWESLKNAFETAINRVDIVISTGGLGPTEDDFTKEVVAELCKVSLKLDEKILENLKERFKVRGIAFPENSKKMALIPENAIPIPNGPGAAPGIFLECNGKTIILLPGVPREMQYMIENFVIERLNKKYKLPQRFSISMNFASIPEAIIDNTLKEIDFEENGITYAILASLRKVQVILSGFDKEKVEEFSKKVISKFPDVFFGYGDIFLENAVLDLLIEKNKTVAFAESCTGGWLGKLITDIPGSSKAFLGGIVSYSNEAKINILNVPEKTIEKFGAVSAQTAFFMANNVRKLFNSDFGIGITGVAGPSQSEKKPAGLVYIAASSKEKTVVKKYNFRGNREMVRQQSTSRAFDLLRKEFLK